MWKVPGIAVHFSAEFLAPNNVLFVVADEELLYKDMIIGFYVLQHLEIDSRTLLERISANLDGTEYSTVDQTEMNKMFGNADRLVIGHLQQKGGRDLIDPDRPHVNLFVHKLYIDLFLDPNLLIALNDTLRKALEHTEVEHMLRRSHDNVFPDRHWEFLQKTVWKFVSTFDTKF